MVHHFGDYRDVERLRARVAELEEGFELLRRAVNEDGLECLPGCDSMAHEELCPYASPGAALRAAEAERDSARADVARLREDVQRVMDERKARVAELEAERDELRGILATTADRLNTALGENGQSEMIGDPYRSLAVRDGVIALYDRGARWRTERDAALAEVARLRTACGLALNAVSDYDGMGRDPVLAESLLRRALPLAKAEEASDD